MKGLTKIVCLIVLLAIHSPVMASGVFKCTGSNGEMTFSFAPCAPEAPVQIASKEASAPKIPRMERLALLDSDIATLEKQLHNTKRDYEQSLRSAVNASNRNELTSSFDDSTTTLIAKLNKLQVERERLATL